MANAGSERNRRGFAVVDCSAGLVDCPIGTSEGGGQSVAVGQGGAVFGPAVLPAVAVGDSTAGAGRKTGVNGPIAKAKVTRNLFPPSLTIEVAERLPVAVAQPTAALRSNSDKEKVGWLDARGGWMPSESYTATVRSQNSSIGPAALGTWACAFFAKFKSHRAFGSVSRLLAEVLPRTQQLDGESV